MNVKELTFPLLDYNEILMSLKDLEISCTLQELQKPSSEKVMHIFENFIFLLLGEKTFDSAMNQSGDNSLHQESLQLINFHKKLIQICTCSGVELVTLRDILAPKAKRTCYVLSALINFCKFREDKMILFEECSNQTDALLAKRDQTELKLNDITDKVNSIRLERAEEQPKVQELRKVTTILASELRDLKKNQTDLAQEMDQLKLEKSKISEKLTNNSFLITNLKQDCVRLQSRIVSDPEKLLQTIQEMSTSVKTDKQNVVMAERKSRELRARLDAMTIVENDLETCKGLLTDADQFCEKEKTAKIALAAQKDYFARKENVLRDMEIKEQQQKRQVKQATDKLSRLEAHKSSRESCNNERREKLESELSRIKQGFEKTTGAKQDAAIQVEQWYDELRETEKSIESEINNLNHSFSKLVSQIGSYQHDLMLEMDESTLLTSSLIHSDLLY